MLFSRDGMLPGFMLLLLTLTGCGPKVQTQVAPGAHEIPISTLAVYPFHVRFARNPAMSYQKTFHLVEAARSAKRFQVYSFGDFQLLPQDNVGLYEGRSLLTVLREDQIDLDGLAMLKGEVIQIEEAPATEGEEEQVGHRREPRRTVKAQVELTHHKQQGIVARAETTFVLDPLAARQDDPYPLLTEQVKQLSREVVALALKRAKVPAPQDPLPITFYEDHSSLFRVASDDAPSLFRKMSGQDEVERSMTLLTGYQYFYPEITPLEIQLLEMRSGMIVHRIHADWVRAAGLEEGDVVRKANGQAVLNVHQLDRQVALAADGKITLEIKRKAEVKEVVLGRP